MSLLDTFKGKKDKKKKDKKDKKKKKKKLLDYTVSCNYNKSERSQQLPQLADPRNLLRNHLDLTVTIICDRQKITEALCKCWLFILQGSGNVVECRALVDSRQALDNIQYLAFCEDTAILRFQGRISTGLDVTLSHLNQ